MRPAVPSRPAPVSMMMPPPPVYSPVPPVRSASRSASRLSMKNKVTKFKSAMGDDLSIPSFGYIDVCFCVDATGSMSGEVAQVQSVI